MGSRFSGMSDTALVNIWRLSQSCDSQDNDGKSGNDLELIVVARGTVDCGLSAL